MEGRRADGWKKNVALAHPYHEGKPFTKFDQIPPSCLRGDSVTDEQKDGQTEAFTISPSFLFCFVLFVCFFKAWG